MTIQLEVADFRVDLKYTGPTSMKETLANHLRLSLDD